MNFEEDRLINGKIPQDEVYKHVNELDENGEFDGLNIDDMLISLDFKHKVRYHDPKESWLGFLHVNNFNYYNTIKKIWKEAEIKESKLLLIDEIL